MYKKSAINISGGLIMDQNELDSTCGVSDDELTKRFIEAVRIENEIKKAKGTPISCYDSETNSAYLLYADGTKKYVRAN